MEDEKKENEQQFKSLVKLLNPAFTFEFAGQSYQVKRANIEQVQQYQRSKAQFPDAFPAPHPTDLRQGVAAPCSRNAPIFALWRSPINPESEGINFMTVRAHQSANDR